MRILAHALALALLTVCLATAQNITGTITGAVDDPAGARIAGASTPTTFQV